MIKGIDPDDIVFVSKNVHIITDRHIEEDSSETAIGTTKRGNGPAYRDKYSRKGKRACDMHELQPYLIDVYEEFHGVAECSILFEGAQGALLDIDHGTYPFVTSSNCVSGQAAAAASILPPFFKVFLTSASREEALAKTLFSPALIIWA